MGTALTERQLKELSRLTRKLYLCFDADAAGEAATLRGMDLAAAQGFDVRVVALPPGADPADNADRFEARIGTADPYAVHRVRLELDRESDRQLAYERVQQFLNTIPDSPQRSEAWRLANDRLGMTVALRAARGASGASQAVSTRVLEAGERLERDALAGVAAHPDLREVLAGLSPDHFDSDLHRRAREHLLEPGETDRELVHLLAELDARAAAEGIDEATTKELLLNLHERKLRRELQNADFERTKELQAELERLRVAATNLV
jgi:DNA primase